MSAARPERWRHGLIAVGWSDREESRRALVVAAALAGWLEARLVVVAAEPAPRTVRHADARAGLEEQVREQVDELLEQTVARDGALALEVVAIRGVEAHAIAEAAEELGASLLVLGTPEPGFVDRMLGTDVGTGVVRQTQCDLLIVR